MSSSSIPGGLLVAIEGIDGAGKTTLAHALRDTLNEAGFTVALSKEPTNGPHGTQMRASAATGRLSPEEELRLLILDRRQHVDELIGPALGRGEIVILDRYFPSNVAYQGAAGLDTDALLEANAFAPRPDLLLLLDLDPDVGLARIRLRGDKPNHFENTDNLSRCRRIFRDMGLAHTVVVDANAPAHTVAAEALAQIRKAIARKAA